MTPKQERFVQEYLVDLNATRAAIAAGYSKKTAYSIGQENLNKHEIKNAINEAMKKREQRTEITQDRILRELARIAFADPRSIAEWGNGTMTLKDSSSLSDDDAVAVSEVSQTITDGKASIKAKMYDKQRALELLGRHLGMFTDKVQLDHSGSVSLQAEVRKALLDHDQS